LKTWRKKKSFRCPALVLLNSTSPVGLIKNKEAKIKQRKKKQGMTRVTGLTAFKLSAKTQILSVPAYFPQTPPPPLPH